MKKKKVIRKVVTINNTDKSNFDKFSKLRGELVESKYKKILKSQKNDEKIIFKDELSKYILNCRLKFHNDLVKDLAMACSVKTLAWGRNNSSDLHHYCQVGLFDSFKDEKCILTSILNSKKVMFVSVVPLVMKSAKMGADWMLLQTKLNYKFRQSKDIFKYNVNKNDILKAINNSLFIKKNNDSEFSIVNAMGSGKKYFAIKLALTIPTEFKLNDNNLYEKIYKNILKKNGIVGFN